jgi:predicted amidohydrolase YtcJ
MACAPDHIKDIRVLVTVRGGEVVHEAKAQR